MSSPSTVAAIILAAGASTRMGRPKARIEWRGRTFVEHCVDLAAGCAPRVVVQGSTCLRDIPFARDVVLQDNPGWTAGPLSSLQRGLAAIDRFSTIRGALVLTVDRPHVSRATVEVLLAAHRSDPDAIVQPQFAGQSGHPIIWPACQFPALMKLPPTSTARTLLHASPPPSRRKLVVEDAAVCDNIDDPRALSALLDPPGDDPTELC